VHKFATSSEEHTEHLGGGDWGLERGNRHSRDKNIGMDSAATSDESMRGKGRKNKHKGNIKLRRERGNLRCESMRKNITRTITNSHACSRLVQVINVLVLLEGLELHLLHVVH
jgi:hypothetical protein